MGELFRNSRVDEAALNLIHSAKTGSAPVLVVQSANTNIAAIVVSAAGPLISLNTASDAVRFAVANNGDVTITGNIVYANAGKGLSVKEGTNAKMGTGTLNGATEVTISTTAVTANSRIFLTIQAPAGTPSGTIFVSSRIAATSFGVKSAASDTSTFAWMIVEPSP
jgi:hypothetical protein